MTLPAFAGSGEMHEQCRAFAWASTPLGDEATWSAAHRTAASLVLASPFPSALLWGDDHTQLYNDAYRAVLGERHPAGLGEPVQRCWPEHWQATEAICARVRAGESVVVEQAKHPVSHEGTTTDAWFTMGYSPVREDDGAIGGVTLTMFDTTAQMAAQQRADRASRTKGDFLTVMSHELRTPLNAIGGYAELLELGVRGPITTEQRGDLTRIQQSQQHLLNIINGVLSYAKLEAGVLHYAVEDVVMDELLARCDAIVATQAREAGLTLRRDSCESRIAARADGEKVQQIVLNLLENAIKFTTPGGRVTLGCAFEADKRVVVRVTDTGCGIAEADLECVFHPFVQVDAKATRRYEGTGLGLAISREMARGMGGDLTVTSRAGGGSTFELTLACGRHDTPSVDECVTTGKRQGDA